MSASIKWRHLLDQLKLLSRAVAVVAEMKGSPQEEMANSPGMKVFAVERHGLPECFEDFVLCVKCNCRNSNLRRIGRLSGVRYYSDRYRERLCASGLRSLELSAQIRQPNSCTLLEIIFYGVEAGAVAINPLYYQ